MADIFVSYKVEDRQRVKPLVEALQADGYSVWWDEQIGGGARWRQTLEAELTAAKSVVVVWSKRSVGPEGAFVQDEATRAQERGVYIPVTIDKVHLPLGFGETQALPLIGWRNDRSSQRYRAVLASVQRLVGEAPPTQPIASSPKVGRRAVIAGSAATTVAIAGGAGWTLLKNGGAAAPSSTVAVLPFANLSGDPAQAYFSDGLAEELRNALSRIAGLSVVARTSSEAVRNDDARTAAARLGVGNIITGSVRRSSQMLRIGAQLIDGKKGLERWSQVYDRAGGDVLQIETDIAEKIAESLSIRLGATDQRRIEQGGTSNADAHDLLLKARGLRGIYDNLETLQIAIGMVDGALALDPNYADAIATKAEFLTAKTGMYSTTADEYRRGYATARQIAQHAIALAPRSPFGYAVLAGIFEQTLHLRAAFALFQRAAALPGEDSKLLLAYSLFLSEIGRADEALDKAVRATELDPLNPLAFGNKAQIFGNSRRYTEAAKTTKKAIELSGGVRPARAYHAYCIAMAGDFAKGRQELAMIWPDLSLAPTGYVAPFVSRDHDLGERVIANTRKIAGDGAATGYAAIYAQIGKTNEALDQLDIAWRIRDPGLVGILVDPMYDPLRSEPRFKALVRELDFPS
jgi:serine/threonine-protein kinase